MRVPEIAVLRAVVAYVYRCESARRAAEDEGIAPVTIRRWLRAAGIRVRTTSEQRALDQQNGRYHHGNAMRDSWRRGRFDTDTFRRSRPQGDWGLRRDGENNSFFGHRHSAETRERLRSYARDRAISSVGEYGPEWTEEFRAAIVSRDGHACTVCRSREMLQVHHVDLDRSNSDPRNLLTLCAACHLGYHGRGEGVDEILAAYAAMQARLRNEYFGSAPC